MASAKQFAETAWGESTVAQRYARAENASGPFARTMIREAKIGSNPSSKEIYAIDLGCGTGAVVAALYDALPKEQRETTKVLAGDISEPMLEFLKERGEKAGWQGLETRTINLSDAENLPKSTFTHLFINFAIFFQPPSILKTLHSLLQPGGFIAISTWRAMPWYTMMSEAASRIPSAPPFPTEREIENVMNNNRPWHDPAFLRQVIEDAGFEDVDVILEDEVADSGTPEQFCETSSIVLNIIGTIWKDDKGESKEHVEKIKGTLLDVAREVAKGDEEGHVRLTFKGIVGQGRKSA